MNAASYSSGNSLLDLLPEAELRALRPRLEVVELHTGQVLYPGNADTDMPFVYFPVGAVTSMLSTLADGSLVEAGTVGREGGVAVQCAFASQRTFERWIAQVPGNAARIRVPDLRDALADLPALRALLLSFIQFYMAFLAQSIACNTRHPIIERCARWLLLTRDRAGRDVFHLTQELLAVMLGARRPGVSIAAATLADAGFIAYSRGVITVVDRAGLESASCECYGLMRTEYRRLFGRDVSGDVARIHAPDATIAAGSDGRA